MVDKTTLSSLFTEKTMVAYECLRRAGAQIPLWGSEFIDTLDTVEVLDEEKK